MKTLLLLLTGCILGGALLVSSAQLTAIRPVVAWNDDLATITWTEPLSDPKAKPNETPFSLLSGPSLGWLTDTEAVIRWEVVG